MTLEVMADQFKGLPMRDLIGGPLMAACDAQVKLANATADFIKVVGFLPPTSGGTDPNAVGGIRIASFKFERPKTPAVSGTDAKMETVTLDVPLLAIINIPALSIKTVDITFDMEVKASEASKDSTDTSASVDATAGVNWGVFTAKVSVKGSVASHKENTRSSDQSAKYHVAVHASDDGMPEGMARVLDILAQAIQPTKIEDSPPP